MRSLLVSSIGVATAAALAVPLSLSLHEAPTPPRSAKAARAAHPGGPGDPAGPGSTRSLPLVPLGAENRAGGGTSTRGLARRDVQPFSLLGVVWENPRAELRGTVQVRTRSTTTGAWSDWQDLEAHHGEHGADSGTAEARAHAVRGATAPLWVGDSNGVEVRVRAANATGPGTARAALPRGLRVELVDPGDDSGEVSGASGAAAASADPEPDTEQTPREQAGESPRETSPAPAEAAGTGDTETEAAADTAGEAAADAPTQAAADTAADAAAEAAADIVGDAVVAPQLPEDYIGPRPPIVTRRGWGADESLREAHFLYTNTVRAAFIHHSATGNNYTCAQAPSLLRSIYRYHTVSLGWRDIGYNFAIDKCGNIYEGRAGGVARAVQGAHTLGFNSNSTGIAVLGTFTTSTPPAAAVTAAAQLTSWKLGLHGRDPRATTTLTSAGGNLYKKGTTAKLKVISGHRDGYATECPGAKLYEKLGTIRTAAAKYQGRS
ncbi:peptidoglycan recognition protein [Streptomyces sp. MUM 203J]|uniref:peptidoglycan recognition protein family protein n=1 Tax=Streptomyces sp. MUM 203J TaxID=2791990 RepID=UPI001F04A1A6|nr:peptidoglycan recognition protein [Streptomyces sp. MUM 203J]MCH0538466.1 peptidoglycan recognition protein [Streptomyces sp. MUM 203J]